MLVVLGLGSNKGYNGLDSFALLDKAVLRLDAVISGLRRASLYETEPLGVIDQPRFLNTAVAGWYNGSPRELLESVHSIETDFGRDRSGERRWGERSLDIDILLFGDLAVSDPPDLELPHPRLRERRFALEPLLELLPCAAEPGTGRLYREICGALPDQGSRRL
ncbi:MAG: 2-amino-4-hydroxy-6-hydroxymethyldihydropteridine diphosphokinase [Treponema sp.]|jgi:2-amino-4-hydroxy-6-hydroxymethyldihydropteridine diphosphokinase|nr:2-amino-4-hydroxy-6-hydroxymethyldihydropteridine diphosphokinase [Treponema sp.]